RCFYFGPAETAASQNRDDRTISLAAHRLRVRRLLEYVHLFGTEPVPPATADSLRTFDPPNAGGQLRAEQSHVSSRLHEAPNCGEAKVDRRRRQSHGHKFKPIPRNNGFAERESRFRTAPRSVFKTALLAKSRSGRRSTRFGVCLAFLRFIHNRSQNPLVRIHARWCRIAETPFCGLVAKRWPPRAGYRLLLPRRTQRNSRASLG